MPGGHDELVAGRSAEEWDARYADRARGWPTGPSSTVVSALDGLEPGRATDLAAGTGRHARWLAERGWDVVAVDFSAVGVEQGRARAEAGGVDVDWVVADVRTWEPAQAPDLVLAAYVQLGVDGFRRAAGWLAPGGRLVVVGHARRNLTDGVHGPRRRELLHSEDELRGAARGLLVERLGEVLRPDDGGTAIDLVLVARRPGGKG